ncbi:hypothetical protein N7510_000513 [Penicillium lagena]|uniref:uncharacterized protein n=1 Tax=Penicillium lagena TaxID=94218 RepID=UPI0025416F47|nr:uncharacterized protein N7510_000513 [Penicillium lagena]KAJ5624204.1 hypothetical protein N7510_000513 [Penicillium lagena]
MGRRKIEIKAIKDDRNRSVTFLKRKGGLFKKAHELAVLCSVDVAVIIFGHNKKLYEYSSCDMHDALGRYQYFGPPHEHKGPDDFSGKRDDDDEEDETTPAPEEIQAVQHGAPAGPPHLQHQAGFQHINHAPSASPPIHNGLPLTRHGTPQSHSRPTSRNHIRRGSSNLGPQQHATPPPPPAPQNGGYAYMQNPSMYNPNVRPGQFQHYGHPPHQGTPPMHPHGLPPQSMPPHHQGPQHMPPHAHSVGPQQQHMGMPQGSHAPAQQQAYMQESSRSSAPPPYAADNQQQQRSVPTSQGSQENTTATLKVEERQSPPQPRSLSSSKSRSIFTPIDDRGSVLARHFGSGVPIYEPPQSEEILQKIHPPQHEPPESRGAPSSVAADTPRTNSISSVSDIRPPMRTNSGQLASKRPQLKVQIPSESSDHGSATAESSSRDSAGNKTLTPAKGNADNPPSGVVLPPPSPSAGAILSAGAQGPPNPFARPPPPGAASQNNYGGNASNPNNNGNSTSNIETPISALPSRFVSDALLPSPSSFFPEWGFGRSGPDSNMLPSPLTFPTPAVQSGPGFSRDDEPDKKRKSPDSGPPGEGTSKKPKK